MKYAPLMSLLWVAACAPQMAPMTPFAPASGADTCGSTAQAGLVGQNATALERVLIMDQVRIIRPGQAVTMDFREERINFELDGADTITRVFCG